MAEKFDAATRLAEGMPSVEAVQNYVWASRMLGYEHPDLTASAAQVREHYASEEGLNLAALEEDCSALQAAATAAAEALARQDAQRVALIAAWHGRGAEASREFLRRHGEASALAATALRAAAHSLAELRDKLWQSVDGKVATVMAIDGRVGGQRADWLAAAQTVTTGAGDRAAASELVDQEVKPFVANVIGGEWMTAMRAAVDAIGAAYDAATAELASEADATFDVPGDLGPAWTPAATGVTATPNATSVTPAAPVAPAALGAPVAPAAPVAPVAPAAPVAPGAWGAPGPPATAPADLPPPAAAPAAADPAAAPAMAPPSMPSLGGGLPGMGSGLSGFAQQLGETLGGLLGGAEEVLAEPEEIEPPAMDEGEDLEQDEPEDEEADELEDEAVAVDPDTACEAPSDDPVPQEDQLLADEEPVAPAPSEALPPPIVEPPVESAESAESPPPDPAAEASGTPCEIAADELPQVGE
ncbi:hypothetical protein [Mycolicibacterium elephantis]|uniref:Uncharacterized protein n=1 Tax=Mycolicibacterium elephantis DSM 44368 TaxID=1335622 RepID=A0A439DX37_9MYCO|nr:hypothetical protein [Mycolicibacterium elephantis]MCV7221903.1 hypothetical protein [Mycolicibacterium elephantis]RWA21894.1 hypothetical protein MELE44368_14460 [Mycolicibacterium elephantis DSM 44368]